MKFLTIQEFNQALQIEDRSTQRPLISALNRLKKLERPHASMLASQCPPWMKPNTYAAQAH